MFPMILLITCPLGFLLGVVIFMVFIKPKLEKKEGD